MMDNPVLIGYQCFESGVRVELLSHVMLQVSSLAKDAGNVETGGILLGRYLDDGLTALVESASPKPPDSGFGHNWFRRGKKGLDKLLEARWRDGVHYVGEWHSHPGADPTPSGPDIEAMNKIAVDPLYRCSAPVLLIVGGERPGMSVSLNVFSRERRFALRYSAARHALIR